MVLAIVALLRMLLVLAVAYGLATAALALRKSGRSRAEDFAPNENGPAPAGAEPPA